MYNRRDLADVVQSWDAKKPDEQSEPIEIQYPVLVPNWAIGLAVLAMVGVGVYLATSPTAAASAAPPASSRAVGLEASVASQRSAFKRAQWAPPPTRTRPSPASKGSRVRVGLLYSDLREAFAGGYHSPLVKVPSAEQWAFNDLIAKLESENALERFLLTMEATTDGGRTVKLTTQGSPEFLGRLQVALAEGRWRIQHVLEVVK